MEPIYILYAATCALCVLAVANIVTQRALNRAKKLMQESARDRADFIHSLTQAIDRLEILNQNGMPPILATDINIKQPSKISKPTNIYNN